MKYRVQMVSIILLLMLVGCGGDTGGSGGVSTSTNESHPLFDMLKRVPMEFVNTIITYTDFRAVEDALPYVERPNEGQIFYNDWTGYIQRWYTGADFAGTVFAGAENYLATVGFELRDVNRVFTFGDQPNNGTLWSGDFDEDAIRTAHTARGYSAVTINDAQAWCYEGDCSIGMTPNVQEREMGNIFDRGLGRKIPFVMWDDTLISTPQQSILEGVTNLSENRLYDNADVRALAQAATAPDGLLVNWWLLSERQLQGTLNLSSQDFNPNDFNSYTYQNLPTYNAVAIADRQEGDRMVALIMLAYNDEASAQSAATEFSARVASFTDRLFRRESEPIWSNVLGALITHSTYASDTGRYVAIVRIEYATPTEEQAFARRGSEEYYAPDARAFNYLTRSISGGGFYPLLITWNE